MGSPQDSSRAQDIQVVEPELPRRVRRPVDLVRLVLASTVLVVVVAVGDVAVGTASGLEQDLIRAGGGVPQLLLTVVGVVTRVGLVAVPVAAAVDLILRGRAWQLLDASVSATAAVALAWLLRQLVSNGDLGGVGAALTKTVTGEGRTPALDILLVASVAFLTGADAARRRGLHPVGVIFVVSAALAGFGSGEVTGLALLSSLLLGWSVALVVRLAAGAPSTRPDGFAVSRALADAGVSLTRLELVTGPGQMRLYHGTGGTGPIQVQVFDKDTYGSTTARRVARRLRLRGPSTRGPSLTVRGALEHQSLMTLSLLRLGIVVPEPVAVCEVGPSAALIATRPSAGLALSDVADAELGDSVLAQVWHVLEVLQTARVAHRGLTSERLLLTPDGQVGLVDPGSGDIAAADLALRLDTAQLLTTVALRVGAARAVSSASSVLGNEPLLRALALLQPVALTRTTRRALRHHKHLLHELRENVLALVPAGESVEQVQVRRLTAKTLVSVVGGAVAAYVLLTQLARVNISAVLASADWTWAAGVVAFTLLTFTGASLVLGGAVATRLSFVRTYLTQLAVAFSGLVAPSAIGNIALNTRFLQKSGISAAVAGSSVALAQIAQFSSYFVLLVITGVLAGSAPHPALNPPAVLVIALVVLAVALAVTLALPFGRHLLTRRLLPAFAQVVPRVVSVFQHPRKVASLFGGALLLDTSFVAALTCATRAFGATPPIATVAVVYFAGAIVGSAVPTPGGLGGIEAALTTGLIAAGMSSSIAVSSVLLYRLATYWLPIPFGWAALNYLQRADAL